MIEKKHLPLGSDFVMKYNQLFVGEVLNCWVCLSGKLSVFLYFTIGKISIKSLRLRMPSSKEGENMYVLQCKYTPKLSFQTACKFTPLMVNPGATTQLEAVLFGLSDVWVLCNNFILI